jgi:mannose-1-phosphate guanylyltransferase
MGPGPPGELAQDLTTGDVVGMVLCAGLGTRLRPLTERLPKPAVPVCGISLVRWTFGLLAGAGIRRAVVNVHHRGEAMAAVARQAADEAGLELAVSPEAVIAGTGGALREARAALAGASTVVVVNGDILFDVDLGAALAAHRASGALATMLLMPMPQGQRYAAVETDPSGAVRRIAGTFGPGGAGLAPWHFTGVHLLAPRLLDHITRVPFEIDVNRHVYPPLMAGGGVRAYLAGGYWNDLGTPERYLAANEDVLAGRVPLARFHGLVPFAAHRPLAARAGTGTGVPEDPASGAWLAEGAEVDDGATVLAPVLIGPGAHVEAGATVGPFAVLGADARVPSGARVEHAVVWSGTALARGEELVRGIAAGDDRVRAAPRSLRT